MSIENIIIISWFLIGLITGTIIILLDMRGEEYNPNYLDGEMKYIILFSLGGCMTLIILIVVFISVWIDKHKQKSRLLTKFIYWIGNIGIKKDGDDNET